jgi:hypothetical protein
MSSSKDARPRHPDSLRPKREVIRVLRRAGIPHETIEALERELGDPVDLLRDGDVLAAHGITRDRLTERFGGGP